MSEAHAPFNKHTTTDTGTGTGTGADTALRNRTMSGTDRLHAAARRLNVSKGDEHLFEIWATNSQGRPCQVAGTPQVKMGSSLCAVASQGIPVWAKALWMVAGSIAFVAVCVVCYNTKLADIVECLRECPSLLFEAFATRASAKGRRKRLSKVSNKDTSLAPQVSSGGDPRALWSVGSHARVSNLPRSDPCLLLHVDAGV